jgi:hypothetical protein
VCRERGWADWNEQVMADKEGVETNLP